MCMLFFILNENAKGDEYKLILAANRDEFYQRPSVVAGPWKEDASVFGGRDMKAGREGGTWLAISTKNNTFKFGILLNIIETERPDDPDVVSRGKIVSDYVLTSKSTIEYCQQLARSTENFDSFILVTVEIR